MKSTPTILTRVTLKNDTEENWNKAINFIPLEGEVIIYNCDDTHNYQRIKVGNGTDTVTSLPFINKKNGYSIDNTTLVLN